MVLHHAPLLMKHFSEMIAFSQEDMMILGLNMLVCIVVFFIMKSIRGAQTHSWYLTFYASFVSSFVGLYFGYHLLHDGFTSTISNETVISRYIALFFIGYCVMDLVVGSVHYVEEISFEDGWIHHLLYITICYFLLHHEMTAFFAVALIEEIPVVLLSFFEVRNKQRPSLLFGVLYFLTRVVFHTVLIYKVGQFSHFVLFSGMVLLTWHVKVFQKWVRGYLMRSASRKRMKYRHKMLIMLSMLIAQVLVHSYAMWDLVTQKYEDHHQDSIPVIALHGAIFLYFMTLFGVMIHDVYCQNFIMTSIGKKKIIYNISWEDPAIDHKVMHMNEDDVVLTISSAGCNVLDYLCEGPKKIIAVDMNAAQLHTLELKLACIKALTWEQFFAIWGRSDYKVFISVYKSKLRKLLQAETTEFWDANTHLFRDNFMYAGTSGLMAKILCAPLWLAGVHKRIVSGEDVGGDRGGFFFWCTMKICSFTTLWSWIAPLGGVPIEQLNLVMRNPEVFVERLEEVLTTRMWKRGNYFYYGYIVGEFSPTCCPRYLEKKNFKSLKERTDRVELFHGTWADAAEKEGPGSITIASLLDSMDWMPHQMIAENILKVVTGMDKERGRIYWRCFGDRVHSPVLGHLRANLVPDYDRVGWYLTTFIGPTPENYEPKMITLNGTNRSISNTIFDDMLVMYAMASHGLSSNKDVKKFYKSQGTRYDGFREALLPHRDVFMQYVVPWTKMPKTWISVGCGTARDIEFVTEHIRESKTKVYLCDLSDALLAMAKSRVKALGLTKQVVFVEGDINAAETQKKLPAEVDLVTCSYCLTMIPPWREALNTMKDLVAPGGNLCLIDFTLREGVEDRWDQRLYKWWFAHDGVYFNRAHVDFLEQQRDLETVWYSENEGRVPYTPFMPTHYMYCAEKISIEKKKTNNRRVNGRSPSPTPRASRGSAASSAKKTATKKSGSGGGKRRSMSPTPRRNTRRTQ